jgi:hypothetical protein
VEEETTNSIIEMKTAYISIDLYRRLLIAVTVCIISFLTIFIGSFFLVLFFGINYTIELLVAISFFPSVVLCSLPLLSQWILRKKTLTWNFINFYDFETKTSQILTISFSLPIIYIIANFFYSENAIWKSISLFIGLIAAVSLLVFLILSAFQGFYTLRAKVFLGLSKFLMDYKKNSNSVDFTALLFASKRLSKIAQDSNMEIDPYKLCLGLSIGCIQNNHDTENDIQDLAKWAQEPRNDIKFLKFKKNIVKYTNLALDASDCGITEKSHWTFERKTAVIGALIIPVIASLLAIIIPKLLETFHL